MGPEGVSDYIFGATLDGLLKENRGGVSFARCHVIQASRDSGDDGRSEDAAVRGSPLTLHPPPSCTPFTPHPSPLADVTLPCPPALVCAAPCSDRQGIIHAPTTLVKII
ncbi:unnamed protein product [Danaus chrysippus]|uniref:(African queen) hypothetical protein n=1 Tax=Danaus chrysippus TaxID=151541 RepID=A0A8J2QDK6_9NEOP|nr:unnamed protein product [Danaus chrysippus]